MSCGHCCFGCRPGIGQDMSKETFIQACQAAVDHGFYICLGGGEPTIHPEFWEFLGLALRYNALADVDMPVWLATNGSVTDDALALAALTRQGRIQAVLSRDEWHDPIDQRVVDAFQRLKDSREHEGIRTVRGITPHGSAKRNQLQTSNDRCCCDDSLVMPNGKFYGCGCRRHSFGHISNFTVPPGFELGEQCVVAWKKHMREEACQNV